jgi:E3 ubiquitin-protein ligase RNF213
MRDFTTLEIEEMLELEQNDYICRMELTPDIAVNQALKENIFAIIPCIINKIPIFICGKPGCSKSLAITLIFANLRGSKSVDSYFKTIEEFVMVSF